MRERLRPVLDALLAASADSGEVTLDQLGDALGTLAVDASDIAWLVEALESRSRVVASPTTNATADLRVVLPATRALTTELARRPTVDEIATRTKLPASSVRAALLLARVISRET